MTQQPLKLYTFAISHFSEKIRWALDAARVPYEEVVWTPAFHLPRTRFKKLPRTSVPIVETADECVQDSTAILQWLEQKRAPFALVPTDPAERREVYAIEERFDHVGENVLRYAYGTALQVPGAVPEMWTVKAGPLARFVLPRIFPAVEPRLRKQFKIFPEPVEQAGKLIAENLAWLDERLADGRRYLVGGRLTAADITAAALLAPLACPDEHPIYSMTRYRDVVAPCVSPFAAPRTFAWVRELYKRDRRLASS